MSKEGKAEVSYEDMALFEDVGDLISEADGDVEIIEGESSKEVVDATDVVANAVSDDDAGDDNDGEDDASDDNIDDDPDVGINADEDDESNDDSSVENEDSSLFTPYAKYLADEGILSTLNIDEFDGTAESLKKAMSTEIEQHVTSHINNYKSGIPDDIKRLIDGYEAGVPFDEMLKITSDSIRYSNVDEAALSENADMQKGLVKDYLDKTTSLTEQMKSKMIEQFENSMELEEQSKNALSELVNIQKYQEKTAIEAQEKQRIEREAYQKKVVEDLHANINDTDEIIPGIKLNSIIKDKITKNLTTPVAQDQNGNPLNKLGKYMMDNPIKGDIVLNYLFEATEGFSNWKVFGKVGKNNAIKELEAAAKAIDGKNKGTAARSRDRNNKNNAGLMGSIESLLNT